MAVKADRTRDLILERASPLFNRKGFDGTSMAELERVTGYTRGALYSHFQDKETFAREAFVWSAEKVKDLLREKLKNSSSNKQKLFAMLDFFSRYVLSPPIPGGCPLLNTAVEVDDDRSYMRPVVARELVSVVDGIASLIRKGIRVGEFKKGTDARKLAYIFFCAIEGALMFSRVEGSSEPMNIVVKHCKDKLDQISIPYGTKTRGRNRPGRPDTAR